MKHVEAQKKAQQEYITHMDYFKEKVSSDMAHCLIKLRCNICDDEFSHENALKEHMKIVHPCEIVCSLCTKEFKENYELENHLLKNHGETKAYKCNECDMKFVSIWRLNKHSKGHQYGRLRKCH